LTEAATSMFWTGKALTLMRESLKFEGSVATFVQVTVLSTERSTEAGLELVLDAEGKVIVRAETDAARARRGVKIEERIFINLK